MSFAEKNRAAIKKLQNLPENRKKIILWTVVVILGLIMGFFWVKGTIKSLSEIGKDMQSIKMPQLSLPQTPALDILQTTTPTNK